MPKGPKGQKRPADVIGNAIKVAKIATGEDEEEFSQTGEGKDAAAQSLGKRGGKARAKKLTPEERRKIAANAASRRWGRGRKSD
ncbi:MAG: RNA-binding protein [Pseudomonadota bacterium]